ncbi:hypothetical protein FRACYDRAFT_248333 [Fragilariopsis cylindrus CCMP1102]|uniref:Uncharacterized protein n=1 Tax=Fragilariopsis cylindrus CCMP1102 TaxID=635003 RepID=A0A1E7EU34_9STRA|nr:hypothetical protein FRACYDRAFT_248333 [Fragilariopsis cylindrus CCMP1102]|eukprot:OEU09481.1 hypothetical protein FRACYDRAFT_248333 [Fragilariopsis cylindrus CCMP1102]
MASDESKNDISTNNGGGGAATPHRSKRINLGTPANYYFKYMNSSKKGESNESMISAKDAEGDNTGTISIPGFNLGGGGPATESSFLSLAGSSVSGSDGSMDMLNKSTLSDTTELTASNFVLVTTSKQNMMRNSIHKKNHDAYKDKENPTKRKASDLKTQSDNPFGVNGSVGLSNQKKPFRHENVENGHEDNTAKAEKLAQGSDRRKDKEEMQEGGSHFVSIKNASPSLRSRISSSPGSLRKFQENLKNSRIQRQVQREEDTKRRLSIENKISLHSMDAQLEELTSEVVIKKRERLPPPFTQLTQKSLSQDSSIADDSLLLSPAQSNTGDSTSSINMADLDDILGIKSSATRESQSSVTARYSSIQSLLGDDSCKECPSGDEQTETLSLLDNAKKRRKLDKEKQKSVLSYMESIVDETKQPTEIDRSFSPGVSGNDRNISISLKFGSADKLDQSGNDSESSSVNNNNNNGNDTASLGDVADLFGFITTDTNSPQNESHISLPMNGQTSQVRDDQETASIGEINEILNGFPSSQDSSSQDINVPRVLSQHGKNNDDGCTATKQIAVNGPVEETSQLRDDQETASIGDIDEILNGFPSSQDSSSQDINVPGVLSQRGKNSDGYTTTKQLAVDGAVEQETASIGDIDEILNGFPSNQDSSSQETNVSRVLSQRRKNSDGCTTTKQSAEKNKLESRSLVGTKPFGQSLSMEKSKKIPESYAETSVSTKYLTTDVMNKSADGEEPDETTLSVLEDVGKSPENISNLAFINKGKDAISNGITSIGGIDLKSSTDALPTPPPTLNLPRMSPDHERSSSKSRDLNREELDHSVEMNLSRSFPKSPIRLIPNSHVKPTPTKLPPTPRRVLNPKNPNSPARNTRSSSKGKSPLSAGLFADLSAEETSSPTSATNHSVLPSSKYHHQSSTADSAPFCVRNIEYAIQNEEDHTRDHTRDNTRDSRPPIGILSCKKNKNTRRSVAFGSPEAAEYNIGSPSESFTPMPRGRAKALFSLPEIIRRTDGNQWDLNHKGNDVDDSNKMTVEQMDNSPELSPIAKSNTDAFQVPPEELSMMSLQGNSCHEERTVELEAGIEDMLANNLVKLTKENGLPESNASLSISQAEGRDNSIDLTDAESIVSIHSKCDKFTADFVLTKDAQKKLNFSFAPDVASECSSHCTEAEEGNTVELEGNIFSLLEAANKKTAVEDQETRDQMDMTGGLASITANSKIICRGKTVELERNMLSLLKAAETKATGEDQETSDQMDTTEGSVPIIHGLEVEEGKTVELEGNMLSLLNAADTKATVDDQVTSEQIDMTGDSVSFIMANSQNISCDVETEGGKTVELEGNMFSLLESAAETKTTEEGKGIILDQMDVTEDSVFMANDSIVGSSKNTTQDIKDEEGKTVELEGNMFSLLEAAAENKSEEEGEEKETIDQMDMTADLVSVAVNGTRGMDSQKSNQIDYLDEVDHKTTRRSRKSLSSSSFILNQVDETQISFIEAVCGEVERRTDLEGTAAASLSTLVEADPKFYSLFQKRFQSNEVGSSIEKFWNLVVEKGQNLVENEWNSWLAMVLESFHGPLNDVPNNFAHDASRLDEALQHCNMLQRKISLANDRKSTRARRKSFMRHQTVVTDLKGEVETIESQLAEMKSELDKIEREEANILKFKTDYHEMRLNAEEYNDLRIAAESAQKSSLSLRGLHSWSMGTVSGKDLEFITLGSCPQTHLKLLYEGNKSDKAQTRLSSSKVDSNHAKTKSLYVYHGPISVFLDSSVKRLMHTVQQRSSLEGSIRIGEHLQNYSWLLGRFDLIAREFQVVQRRYNGKLRRTHKDVDRFSVIVEFQNETSKIVVDFGIEPMMYPSFPVEIRLDLISGELDLDKLRKNLVKNAKPGFGSITRACDIVQSIIRG